jgi:hypothetical protein
VSDLQHKLDVLSGATAKLAVAVRDGKEAVLSPEQCDSLLAAMNAYSPTFSHHASDCYNCATPWERMQRMFVCPICENKRCPKATDHRLDCTGSNDPGQPGSRYHSDHPYPLDLTKED